MIVILSRIKDRLTRQKNPTEKSRKGGNRKTPQKNSVGLNQKKTNMKN